MALSDLLIALPITLLLTAAVYSTGDTHLYKGGTSHEGDFTFDSNTKLEVDLNHEYTELNCPVRRLWGVPDMPAYVGRIFQLKIPKDAFSGKIQSYKVTDSSGVLPSWLWLDSQHGILKGVPGPKDRGDHRLQVTAIPSQQVTGLCSNQTDIFIIEVKNKKESTLSASDGQRCHLGEDDTRLNIILGKTYNSITPKQRLTAIIKISTFMALHPDSFVIYPNDLVEEERSMVLMAGHPGGKKKHVKLDTSVIQLTVGCNGDFWPKHSILVHQIKQQVLDGTLTDVIGLPVTGWKVVKYKHSALLRKQRQILPIEGSAYDDDENPDDEDYSSAYGEEEEDYEEFDIDKAILNKNVEIVPQVTNKTEDNVQDLDIKKHFSNNFGPAVIVPISDNTTEESKPQTAEETVPIIPEYSTVAFPSQTFTEATIELSTPAYKFTDFSLPDISTGGRYSTPQEATTTEKLSTVIGRTTETVEFSVPVVNFPPKKQHRTKKVAVTAGKYFSYIIPEDLFIDAEDGTNLKLAMYDTEHTPLKFSSWVQFDPKTREVYGLPLEEHVSKWEYLVEATDSSGASVVDTLDITVQQHKGRRTVNHEFSMKLRVQKKYPAVIDWQIRALKGLVSLFRDTDMDQITVIEVDLDSDPMQFVWTNDTLPRSTCPKSDIDRLMGVLQSTPEGDPSPGLQSAMSPELLIKSVAWKGTGACRAPPTSPPPQPPHHPDNFGPMPRNQIDHINATAGKLLVFKVPDDTFYDPEDGSARNLKMWLTKGDRSALSPHNWLQFDTKNQEFYGLPMERDIGRREYQLVCEDSGGLTANDGLLVEVHSAPRFSPTVEFHMTIDNPSIESATAKRKFIEKLQNLFGDPDTSMIKIKNINYRPTMISWYNTSLPSDRCPEEEIKQLRNILVGSDGSVTERADVIMGVDFPVVSVSLSNRGLCAVGVPRVPDTPVVVSGPSEDAAKPVNTDNYLITFIVPAVVIVCMIIIASIIACILYKRRRTGKMDVGDDEEKQAFRPKIPVIFQDELDEKPDPSNKSPVIMKEEKPPLLPPPEYKGMDSSSPTPSHTPYHPPPPFTASRDTPRNNRPKPSPAYRKPPPYVPP